jgi:hypothetical protein
MEMRDLVIPCVYLNIVLLSAGKWKTALPSEPPVGKKTLLFFIAVSVDLKNFLEFITPTRCLDCTDETFYLEFARDRK